MARSRLIASVVVLSVSASVLVSIATPARALTFVRPTRIMPLGDSITWGEGGTGGGGYRPPLVQHMVGGRYSSDLVGSLRSGPPHLYDRSHEGHPGYRIDELAAIVPESLAAHRPDIILLQIGTNDVLQQFELETAGARLRALITLIGDTRPAAELVVASITPLADPSLDADVREYNAQIPGIVEESASQGRHVSFLDMYPVIDAADLVDGVHPSQDGYDKMAAAWAARLAEMRPAPPPVSTPACPCTVWGPSDAPTQPQVASTTPAEIGVKFRTEVDGFINGIRFFKGTANVGTHIGSLWTATGDLLAEATFTAETGSGWQEVSFTHAVPVQAHTVYIASYFAPGGRYAADDGYFRNREVVNSPVRLPSQGSINGNGVIRLGSHGFPVPGDPSPQHDTNYWVDVVFEPGTATPPEAPATLTATGVSASQIDLTWASATGATGYRVERSSDGTGWGTIATPSGNTTSYSDTGLTADTSYSYRVVATNAAGDSPPSPIATATTTLELARDAYARSLTGGWGAADIGGMWTILGGNAPSFAVNGSVGTVAVPSNSGHRVTVLGTTSARDVAVVAQIGFASAVSGSGKAFADVVLRRQGAAHYRVGIGLNSKGVISLRGQTSSGRVVLPTVNTGITYVPGDVVLLRVEATQANPTTLRARVWRVGTPEPPGWHATSTDNTSGLQGVGSVGVRVANTTGSSNTVLFDDFVASGAS